MATATAPTRRRSTASRRAGHLIAATLLGVFLFLLNGEPGWRDIPFLTGDTAQVIGLVNVSLIVSLVANLLYAGFDRRWLKNLGDLVTTGIGLIVLIRIWQVFPFDFTGYWFDWPLLIRILLIVGIAGSAIGLLVHAVSLRRSTRQPTERPTQEAPGR